MQNSESPKCPYCGHQMHFRDTGNVAFYRCSNCASRSPETGGFFALPMSERRARTLKDANTRYIDGDTSDGYHTFNELYDHRAKLFSVIVRSYRSRCWKSKLHHDGTMYDGMFIVGIDTPDGQASYHYDIDPYWDMFDCKELENAPEWDGHTPEQAINRIVSLGFNKPLTLAEVLDGLKKGHVFYIEDSEEVTNTGWDENGAVDYWLNTDINKDLMNAAYGVSWRCWASKPTEEERKAAEWED